MRLITLPAGSIVEVGGERLVTTRDGVWPEVNVPAQPARSDATAPALRESLVAASLELDAARIAAGERLRFSVPLGERLEWVGRLRAAEKAHAVAVAAYRAALTEAPE